MPTPTRVVTSRERPISEKRTAYAAPLPGSITRHLAKPGEYSSRAWSARGWRRARRPAQGDERVEVEARRRRRLDLDDVGARRIEVDLPEDLPVARGR